MAQKDGDGKIGGSGLQPLIGNFMYKTYHLAVAFILFATSHIVSAHAEYQGTPVSTTVFVLFANGSTAFRPTTASVETLLNARDAAMVTSRCT